MSTAALPDPVPLDADVLGRLSEMSGARDLGALAARMRDLRAWIASDLVEIEAAIGALEQGSTPVHRSGRHLLASGGKRLRPMCVALAARVGTGFSPRVRDLAVASELVHAATLLHDDVVDEGDTRRGAPTSRVLFGNTASIFAGDWLLVEALRRIQRAGLDGLTDRAIEVVRDMIMAEAAQLANRGRLDVTLADYFAVVDGKTASLFRWALYAGGRAGGLREETCAALERFGSRMGLAFQVTDDVVDLEGDPHASGKTVFGDLREGKLTHPLLVAIARRPALGPRIATAAQAEGNLDPALVSEVSLALRETGALDESRTLARTLVSQALDDLHTVPAGPARDALESVAAAIVDRHS